jgi:hypothetical protein
MNIFSPVRPREAPPFKVGKKARLRVNLEQAPAFRPVSRKVHCDELADRPGGNPKPIYRRLWATGIPAYKVERV